MTKIQTNVHNYIRFYVLFWLIEHIGMSVLIIGLTQAASSSTIPLIAGLGSILYVIGLASATPLIIVTLFLLTRPEQDTEKEK